MKVKKKNVCGHVVGGTCYFLEKKKDSDGVLRFSINQATVHSVQFLYDGSVMYTTHSGRGTFVADLDSQALFNLRMQYGHLLFAKNKKQLEKHLSNLNKLLLLSEKKRLQKYFESLDEITKGNLLKLAETQKTLDLTINELKQA